MNSTSCKNQGIFIEQDHQLNGDLNTQLPAIPVVRKNEHIEEVAFQLRCKTSRKTFDSMLVGLKKKEKYKSNEAFGHAPNLCQPMKISCETLGNTTIDTAHTDLNKAEKGCVAEGCHRGLVEQNLLRELFHPTHTRREPLVKHTKPPVHWHTEPQKSPGRDLAQPLEI